MHRGPQAAVRCGGLIWCAALWQVKVAVTYSIVAGDELWISYAATTTKTTPLSLTNHAYFDLSAGADPTCEQHTLQLNCASFNPDDGSGDGVPKGWSVSVAGTARDYRKVTPVAAVISGQAKESPQWKHG